MWREFKEFAMKGSVLDLAFGVIIGAAFSKIVDSFVSNIITPLIGLILGKVDIKSLSFGVGGARVSYGLFLNAVLDFLLVAFVLFLVVKQINRAKKDPPPDPAIRECPFCTTNISSRATKCPSCTGDLSGPRNGIASGTAIPGF